MLTVTYVLLGLLIGGVELRRRFRRAPVDAFSVFNALYFIFFVFVPINVICFDDLAVRQKYAFDTFGGGDEYTAWALIFTYFFFYLGKSIKLKTSWKNCQKQSYLLGKSAQVAATIFFFGVVAMGAHIERVGGVFDVILMAQALRAETLIQSQWLWLNFFSQFLADTFVLLCAVVIGKRSESKKIPKKYYLGLLVAFIGFVYYALSTGGRRSFIYPILIVYLIHLSIRAKIEPVKTVGILCLIFGVAGLGTVLLSALTTGSQFSEDWGETLESSYFIAVQGLADTFIHFVGAQHAELWQFGFLSDLVSLPMDFFPSQLLGFERAQGMLGETSEFFLGKPLQDGFSGEEPLGLHGYLLVNFGYVGMCFVFFVLGFGFQRLDEKLKPAVLHDSVGWLVYWWVFFGFFVYFREGAVIFVIKTHLTWWVTIALLFVVARKPRVVSAKIAFAARHK
jgi:oligosaccharide repeat unit polymerase